VSYPCRKELAKEETTKLAKAEATAIRLKHRKNVKSDS
jgi:hypothetical protein|tara:strand:+ start:3941 stop:4054 length:114 start_codon:yes stop_codon:yes gene_type:complete